MSLTGTDYAGGDIVRPLPVMTRHAILKAGGAAALNAAYLDVNLEKHRLAVVGATVQGVLAGAGKAVLEMRKAPLSLPAGVYNYADPTYGDSPYITPGTEWDTIATYAGAAAATIAPTLLLPQIPLAIPSRVQHSDLDVPLLRWRDADSVIASQAGTFSGLPLAGETVTIFGATGTWVAALSSPAVADEILLGSTAAICAEHLRRWINGGLGRGTSYSTSTTNKDKAYGYAVQDGHATIVTVRAYAAGTAGNALTCTDTMTNFGWGAGTLASGADGNLGSATNDYLEVVLYYVLLKDRVA